MVRNASRRSRRLLGIGLERMPGLLSTIRGGSYSRARNERDDAALVTVMTAVLRSGSSAIDVGAHTGEMLAHMTRIAPNGRHLAFEPLSDHAARLRTLFPNADVRNVALGDRSGAGQFLRRPEPALSSLEDVPAGEDPARWRGPIDDGAVRTPIEVRRLDDEVPPGLVPALIKIDVEGTEHAVLAGAQETLARYRPVVALEHSLGAIHHGYPAGGIHDLLSPHDLRIFDADGTGPYSRSELEMRVLSGTMWFYFAFPA